jgi:hypothetical protein
VCDRICIEASCDDEVTNQGEADVDCGGPCAFCRVTGYEQDWASNVTGLQGDPAAALWPSGDLVVAWVDGDDILARWFTVDGAGTSAFVDANGSAFEADIASAGESCVKPNLAIRRHEDAAGEAVLLFQCTDATTLPGYVVLAKDDVEPADTGAWIVPSGNNFEPAVALQGDIGFFAWGGDSGDAEWRRRDLVEMSWIEGIEGHAGEGHGTNALVDDSDIVWLAWIDASIVLRRYEDGVPIEGAPFEVSAPAVVLSTPQIVALEDGRHVLAWSSYNEFENEIWIRFFDAEGVPEAPPTEVWIGELGQAPPPNVRAAALGDGGFVLAWDEFSGGHIRVWRFDANGEPVTDEPEEPWLDDQPSFDGLYPVVVANDQHVLVLWENGGVSSRDIVGELLAY